MLYGVHAQTRERLDICVPVMERVDVCVQRAEVRHAVGEVEVELLVHVMTARRRGESGL